MDVTKLDFQKRRLLKSSAYAVLLSTLGLLPAVSQAATRSAARYRPGSDTLSTSMQALGRAYLQKYPHENSRSTLLSLLESRAGSKRDGLYGLSRDGLRTAIQEDFSTDDVVFLKDWSLARTEARLCALSVV